MISVLYSLLWIIASFWLVEWGNWELYYPTVLFSIAANLLYEIIFSKYPLWSMESNGLPNRTLNILLLSLVGMPLSTLVYLSNFPFGKSLIVMAGYMALFIIAFVLLEYIAVLFGSITYHHGWSLVYSFLFDIGIFVILLIHYVNPLWAWAISFGMLFVIAIRFNLTLGKMR